MLIRTVAVTLMLLCFIYSPISAEPTPSIAYLMNEPASLFDLGMFKLKHHLENSYSMKEMDIMDIGVVWEENLLKIFIIPKKKVRNPSVSI